MWKLSVLRDKIVLGCIWFTWMSWGTKGIYHRPNIMLLIGTSLDFELGHRHLSSHSNPYVFGYDAIYIISLCPNFSNLYREKEIFTSWHCWKTKCDTVLKVPDRGIIIFLFILFICFSFFGMSQSSRISDILETAWVISFPYLWRHVEYGTDIRGKGWIKQWVVFTQ